MYKNIIANQLDAASKTIQSFDGTELYIGLLDVCGELANMVSSQLSCKDIDNEVAKDITARMTYIDKSLVTIAKTTMQTDCLKVSTESIDELNSAIAQQEDLLKREQNAKKQLEEINPQIETLKPEVEKLEGEFKIQEAFKETLEKNIEQFSEENFKAITEENEKLTQTLAKKKKEHDDLIDKQKNHQSNIAELDKKIAQLPTEAQLVKAYDAKMAEYNRLLTAQEECSVEKQLEIQEEISNILGEVSKLEDDMKILKDKKVELDKTKTNIETEKGDFETDFIDKLNAAMDDLKNRMESHRDTLNVLKEDAITLKEHIAECDEISKNYRFMFDATKTPLEAIAKASKTEYTELAKNFDINQSEYVRELKADIEKKLAELDQVVQKCTAATTVDQQLILKKAFEKGTKQS